MSWIKYNKNSLVNLDKITDIHFRERENPIATNRKGWVIYLYDGENISFPSKIYNSIDECMNAFDYLTKCLETGKQYIDITDVSQNQKI